MLHSIRSIAKENSIDIDKRLDWVGRLDQDKGSNDDVSISLPPETLKTSIHYQNVEFSFYYVQCSFKRQENVENWRIDLTDVNSIQS